MRRFNACHVASQAGLTSSKRAELFWKVFLYSILIPRVKRELGPAG